MGAWQDDDGGKPPRANRCAVWVLFLDGVPKRTADIDADIDAEDFFGYLDLFAPGCP